VTQQRRFGGDSEAAVVSWAADKISVHPEPVKIVVRIALDSEGLDADGRRPWFDDMPPDSQLMIDASACPRPAPDAVMRIADAMRRGVQIEIVTDSTSGARAWHGALERLS
jgi:hypothetical protein